MPTSRFPHPDSVAAGGRRLPAAEAVRLLAPFVSEARRVRIAGVVASRTYTVVPALEGVHDLGNVNAVLRSAEGLGYGAAHLAGLQGDAATWAERLHEDPAADALAPERVRPAKRQSQGADKWLDLRLWPDADALCGGLHAAGYRVVATSLGPGAVPIAELDFTRPTALVFGSEADGVSEQLLTRADAICVLPLDGFVESYNVSVAAALGLYHARQDRLARQGRHADLSAEEREALAAQYYLRSVKEADRVLARLAAG